jgi:hypothetical protein
MGDILYGALLRRTDPNLGGKVIRDVFTENSSVKGEWTIILASHCCQQELTVFSACLARGIITVLAKVKAIHDEVADGAESWQLK